MSEIKRHFFDLAEEIQADLYRLSGRCNNPSICFIIFGQGRTGSSLLQSLLNSHPNIQCEGEILMCRRLSPWRKLSNRVCKSRSMAYGFKLKHWHMHAIQQRSNSREFVKELSEQGWKIIYISRQNLIRHALSLYISVKTGIFVTTNPSRSISGITKYTYEIDVPELLRLVQTRTEETEIEMETLKGLPYLDIIYERDLLDSRHHQVACERIFSYLGLRNHQVNSNVKKILGASLQETIINYDELEAACRNGPFEKYLFDSNYDN